MSDYQFTRGDWQIAHEAFNPQWRGDGTEVFSEYGRIAETSVNGLRDPDECRANARLIAAAPDLLVALEMMTGAIKAGLKISNHEMSAANDAIAKALSPSHDSGVKP